jgi:hypothetical protein
MAVAFSDRIRVVPNVLFRRVSDEAVLVNLNTEVYLGLNGVGARMWSALTDASSVQAAYDALLEEYEIDPSELRRDLEAFIERLFAEQLIESGTA